MTDKNIRQLFVERLAKVGVSLVNTLPDDMGDPMEALTDEQFAEFDAALNDIEAAARTDELSKVPNLPTGEDGEAATWAEWLDTIPASFGLKSTFEGVAHEAHRDGMTKGREEQRRAGLNDAGEVPELILPNVNAVEMVLDEAHNMFVTVDGRVRLTLGEIDRLIIRTPDARYVVLRDGEPLETLPNTPEPADVVKDDESNIEEFLPDDGDDEIP